MIRARARMTTEMSKMGRQRRRYVLRLSARRELEYYYSQYKPDPFCCYDGGIVHFIILFEVHFGQQNSLAIVKISMRLFCLDVNAKYKVIRGDLVTLPFLIRPPKSYP